MTIVSLFTPVAPPRAPRALVLRCLIANDLSTINHLTAQIEGEEMVVKPCSHEHAVLLEKLFTVMERVQSRRRELATLSA